MIASTLGILFSLSLLEQLPPAPAPAALAQIAADPEGWRFPDDVLSAVDANAGVFPLFLGLFVCLFAFSGAGNGSLYKMIPHVFRDEALAGTDDATPERELALVAAGKKASAAAGLIGAVGALGGFLIPITFNSPWVSDPLAATKLAFWVFTAFYAVCAVTTWAVYVRRNAAHPGI
jgi:NNP family nitrate/nitrite transporter-like MFS transporter